MKWANVLSEIGGVYPFVISLPVTFAKVTPKMWVAVVAAAIFSIALYVYELSRYSISARFKQSFVTRTLSLLICASPVLGVLAVRRALTGWIWVASIVVALAAQAIIYLARRPAETAAGGLGRMWERRV